MVGDGKKRNAEADVYVYGDGQLAWETTGFSYPLNVQFECTRCALCCGDNGNRRRRIVMLREETRAIAEAIGKSVNTFAGYIKNHAPYTYVMKKNRGRCPFLRGSICTIYTSRPLVCRFYPFELTTSDGRHVFRCTLECPGIGRGPRLGGKYFERLLQEAYRRLGNLEGSGENAKL